MESYIIIYTCTYIWAVQIHEAPAFTCNMRCRTLWGPPWGPLRSVAVVCASLNRERRLGFQIRRIYRNHPTNQRSETMLPHYDFSNHSCYIPYSSHGLLPKPPILSPQTLMLNVQQLMYSYHCKVKSQIMRAQTPLRERQQVQSPMLNVQDEFPRIQAYASSKSWLRTATQICHSCSLLFCSSTFLRQ